MTLDIIALDLEGTLISNAISQYPRPHLYQFLEGCHSLAPRLVMYTTVSESRFREIAALLVSEGVAPSWFSTMEYIAWTGREKDLAFIPGADINKTVLVDDVEAYVADGQLTQWIPIAQFASPYPDTDTELLNALEAIRNHAK